MIRSARLEDEAALTRLLTASYGTLLAKDYAPEVLAAALPTIGVARPSLLAAAGYQVAEAGDGALVGAGGWTWLGPTGGAAPMDWGHMRHVAVDPRHAGQGIGSVILGHAIEGARGAGVRVLSCLSTLTARGFYARHGFVDQGQVSLSLAPGLSFPAVQMRLVL
ncbi:GNAT family N-acetyltransferase [Maritimibacter sp. DP1N21-5]|nr:GNAT family N-acetyltransferase [Maritimibacter sp. DP1N21-5]